MANSLLFIPDISGFSKFVTQTEIRHSQHIIAELLDLVIDANEIGLEVSEIEGDAVLFYKHEDIPPLEKIIEQVRTLFVRFHTHLRQYDRDRICQCGACSLASGLSLKVVVHTGEMEFIQIREHRKLHGSAVIVAHRLLKNEIPSREYALFSESFNLDDVAQTAAASSWAKHQLGESKYPDVGTVRYAYLPLADLHQQVVLPPPPPLPERQPDPIVAELTICRPASEVFELVVNLDFRMLWIKVAEGVEYDKNQMNRLGTQHLCVFPSAQLNFETVTNDFGDGKLVYGELVAKFPLLREFSNYFILTPIGEEECHVRMEVHLKPYPIIGKLLTLPIRKKLSKNIPGTLADLKELAESQTAFEEVQTDSP